MNKKLIAFLLLVSLGLLGGVLHAGQSNYGGITIDSNSDAATTSSTKVFKIMNTSGTEVFSITAAGAISIASGGTLAITSLAVTGDITFTGNVTATKLIATQYVQIPYFSKVTRPASGADKGSLIQMTGANSGDCGVDNVGANTTYVLCQSDGTNWKAV